MDYLSLMCLFLAVLHIAYAGYLYHLVQSGVHKAKWVMLIFLVAAVIDTLAAIYILK